MKKQIINSPLGNMTPEDFLTEYWQKKPLLIRNALPNYSSPITADELAGLACEEEVESRLVLEKGGKQPWELRCGPFDESEFCSLPESHWTLLIQEANKHLPQLSDLLAQFNFIPTWWFDDIMISYAPDKGTVGPHYDQYDVFLLQVEGKKSWKISTHSIQADNYLDNTELRIMENFEAEQEWILEPGDMLYLPPGVAHHGIAIGDSVTFSIGYRALSQNEMLSSFIDFTLEQVETQHYYRDPSLGLQKHPGEINAQTIDHITELLKNIPFDQQSIGRWFAQYTTEPSNNVPLVTPADPYYSAAQCLQQFKTTEILLRNEHCRFNFIRSNSQEIQLFIDGQHFPLNSHQSNFGILICDQASYQYQELSEHLHDPHCLDLLLTWINNGILYFPYNE